MSLDELIKLIIDHLEINQTLGATMFITARFLTPPHRVLIIFQAWDNRVKGIVDRGGGYAATKKKGRRRRPEK